MYPPLSRGLHFKKLWFTSANSPDIWQLIAILRLNDPRCVHVNVEKTHTAGLGTQCFIQLSGEVWEDILWMYDISIAIDVWK